MLRSAMKKRRILALAAVTMSAIGMATTAHADPSGRGPLPPPASTNNPAGMKWRIYGKPTGRFSEISFPMAIVQQPNRAMYYYANTFSFASNPGSAYTGMQSLAKGADGQPRARVVFSTFVNGATTTDPLCHTGTDGHRDRGVTCDKDVVDIVPGRIYRLQVKLESGSTWVGTLIDPVTGQRSHIGRWTLPDGAGKLKKQGVSWVERYTGGALPPCNANTFPKFEVLFGNPTAEDGAFTGEVSQAVGGGRCKGKNDFASGHSDDGTLVEAGFSGGAH